MYIRKRNLNTFTKLKNMSKKKKSNRKTYLVALLVVTVGLIAYFALRPMNQVDSYVKEEPLNIPFDKGGELVFIGHLEGDTLAAIDIEVADDNQKRARGLMYRSSIPENGGMLFIHNYEEVQSYWMKNTYISLDILFIDANREIVTIHHNTTPLREWSYASTQPVLYVLEVNAGFCGRHHIQEGDRVDYSLLGQ